MKSNERLKALGEKLRATLTPEGREGSRLPYLLAAFQGDWNRGIACEEYGFATLRDLFLAIPEFVTLVIDRHGHERVAVTNAPETAHINELVDRTKKEKEERRERLLYHKQKERERWRAHLGFAFSSSSTSQSPVRSENGCRPPPVFVPHSVVTVEPIIPALKINPEYEEHEPFNPNFTVPNRPHVITPLKPNPKFEKSSYSSRERIAPAPKPKLNFANVYSTAPRQIIPALKPNPLYEAAAHRSGIPRVEDIIAPFVNLPHSEVSTPTESLQNSLEEDEHAAKVENPRMAILRKIHERLLLESDFREVFSQETWKMDSRVATSLLMDILHERTDLFTVTTTVRGYTVHANLRFNE